MRTLFQGFNLFLSFTNELKLINKFYIFTKYKNHASLLSKRKNNQISLYFMFVRYKHFILGINELFM